MKHVYLLIIILFFITGNISKAQILNKSENKETPLGDLIKKVKINGLFQTYYANSLTSGVNYKGVEFGDAKHSSGSFDIRRARINLNAEITNKISLTVLANLAEFKSDTKGKVLENAFLEYKLNRYLNFRAGQFRPMLGPENLTAVDIIKSLDYSNQYSGMGANGWGGFQVGADISGSVDLGNMPMSYSLAAVNGNGRNNIDGDNGKQLIVRDAFRLSQKYKLDLGFNGGWGRVKDKNVYMTAIDLTTEIPLADQWSLYLQGQYGQGSNHNLYFSNAANTGHLSDYMMRGWFVLPNVRYELGKKYFHSIEFSCRYEEWEENVNADNRRTTLTPAVSFELLKNYDLRFVLAVEMNRYQHNIPGTSQYNSNILVGQLQARF